LRVLKVQNHLWGTPAWFASSQDDPLRVLKVVHDAKARRQLHHSFIPGRPVEGTESWRKRSSSCSWRPGFIPGRPVEGTESECGSRYGGGPLRASSQDDPLRVLKEPVTVPVSTALGGFIPGRPVEGTESYLHPCNRLLFIRASSQDDPLRVLKGAADLDGQSLAVSLHPRTTR